MIDTAMRPEGPLRAVPTSAHAAKRPFCPGIWIERSGTAVHPGIGCGVCRAPSGLLPDDWIGSWRGGDQFRAVAGAHRCR